MTTCNYEVTILVPNSKARADLEGTLADVRAIYEGEGVQFLSFDKLEERALAYPIKGETSAVYFLAYFTAETDAIERIEGKARLSDSILRQLIISRPGADLEKIKDQRLKQAERAAERETRERESRERDGRDYRDRDGRDRDGRDRDGRDRDYRERDGRERDGRERDGREREGSAHAAVR